MWAVDDSRRCPVIRLGVNPVPRPETEASIRQQGFQNAVRAWLSGVVLGLGNPFGLVRYWWVVIKLVINIVVVALVPIALRPEVIEQAEQGHQLMAGLPANLAIGDLTYRPIVSPIDLIVATILAVFKAWSLSDPETAGANARRSVTHIGAAARQVPAHASPGADPGPALHAHEEHHDHHRRILTDQR